MRNWVINKVMTLLRKWYHADKYEADADGVIMTIIGNDYRLEFMDPPVWAQACKRRCQKTVIDNKLERTWSLTDIAGNSVAINKQPNSGE